MTKMRDAVAIVLRLTDASMTRMEAFKVVEASGELDIPWESFKKVWHQAQRKRS